ncbi:MAG: isoleucine--tRNA ligase [Cryomorphaceae bacterium]|nr:isoleucine--tRNA ligase [Cryomorphaceae bacterium]
MGFREYKGLNLPNITEELLAYWEAQDIFKKSIDQNGSAGNFVFYEGPPSANGVPGIHHVMGRAIKDTFCRYKTLKGFKVNRKAGWDTHGLPVELGVEKELGITKEDIGIKITVDEYNAACKKAVMKYTDIWNTLTRDMGYWVDMSDPYVTYDSKYMESVWWLLGQLYEKNLLYKGYTIQPYSPKAGTGLSSHELNQPDCYKNVKDTSIVAQFKWLPNQANPWGTYGNNRYFLAWTTTPWTLPSNTALTVGPGIDYVLVYTFNPYTFESIEVVCAMPLVSSLFGKGFVAVESSEALVLPEDKKTIPFLVGSAHKGQDLFGLRYEQLLPYCLPFERAEEAFRVIGGAFVTTEDGTGIVHTAPTFGADDARVAQEAGVPPLLVLNESGHPVPLVDLQGRFISSMGNLAGKYVKQAYYEEGSEPEKSVDVEIAIHLKETGYAFKVEKYEHSYPHCWRTDKPVLYYPLDSWFIRVSEHREMLAELNKTIQWKPESTGTGRFGKWLENANDWNLSRSRYWGIPIPIWSTENGDERRCIGSLEALKSACEEAVIKGYMKVNPLHAFETGNMSAENYLRVDMHKNQMDEIILVSPSGQPMRREADLIDVWFDSGAMPFAQWHYPFENSAYIDNGTHYPADFIAEGVDQTRGWFYTLHTISALVFGKVAYKSVVSNGLVLDKHGLKMSKRLQNTVDPFVTLAEFGADATRWYMLTNAQPWDNLKFDESGIKETQRKFFGTLYNTYSFFALYANIDAFDLDANEIPLEKRPEMDRWVLSRLNSLIQLVDDCYNQYDATNAGRHIQDFVCDQLSNWYVRLGRRRFWKNEDPVDKLAAYQTLYTCLKTISILSAPIAPFYMDRLYLDLTQGKEAESVHLAKFPSAQQFAINAALEQEIDLAQRITSMVLSLRKKEKIRVRQPLKQILIPTLPEPLTTYVNRIAELVKSEVNVKELTWLDARTLVKQIKPNFKTIGPKYGQQMKGIAAWVTALSSDEIQAFESNDGARFTIDGTQIHLTMADVEISTKDVPGWAVASEGILTVALDVEITPALKAEGIAREVVNRIQNARKEGGFEVTDKILVQYRGSDEVHDSISTHVNYIGEEVLASHFERMTSAFNGVVQEEIMEANDFIFTLIKNT